MQESTYYHLYTLSKTPCEPARQWYEKAKGEWICMGCTSPMPHLKSIDVYLEVEPENIPLNFVAGMGIGIVKREFIEQLGISDVEKNLYLGKVYDLHEEVLKDFVSFRGKRILFIRGNEKSSFRICNQCSRRLYYPMGRRYLIKKQLTTAPIYESQFNQLIINEYLYQRIKVRRWKKLGVEKLLLGSEPKDGRGEELGNL